MTHTPTVLYSLRAQLTDPRRTVEPSHGDPAVTIAAADRSRRRANVIPPADWFLLDIRARQRALSRGLALIVRAASSNDHEVAQALCDAGAAHLRLSGVYGLPDGSPASDRVTHAMVLADRYGRALRHCRVGSDERAALRRACAQYVAAHDAAIAAALGETPERPARSHSAEIDLLNAVTL